MLRSRALASLVIGSLALSLLSSSPAHQASAGVGDTVYLPNVTKKLGGEDGWQTPFIVQNVGSDPTALTMDFFAFSDGRLVKTRSVDSLAPGNSVVHDPNSDPDLAAGGQFSVVVRSTNSPVVSVVNEHQNVRNQQRQEALSYQGLSEGSTKVFAPYFAYNVAGWLTTLVVQNLGGAATSVTLDFASYTGGQKATLTRALEAGRAQFVDPRVEPLLLVGTEYSVTLTASQPIGVIVNAHNDAPSATAPMGFSYSGAPATNELFTFMPYAARNGDGVGRSTRLFVQNVATTPGTPTLVFHRPGIAQIQTTLTAPQPLAPGATWSVDMGTNPQLTDGDYSVYARNGQFAIVAATINPTSAMGATGVSAFQTKWFLPNVTRTLGGSDGWTTPIWIQAASFYVTTARLSWYRFADGALVTQQLVTGLYGGTSVKVDPRSVTGLSDNTQYAVVVEAPAGGVAVIVTELNFQGGDGAMVYEAFATPAAGGFGVSGCTPLSAPAGTVFRCRFYGLPPGATPVTVTTTNPTGNPSTSTFNEPVAADGSTTLYTQLTTQGNRTITASAGSVSVPATALVGPANFSLTTTTARNGSVSLQTKAAIACAMYALQPDNNVSQAIPGVVMTGITDVTGVLTFSYQPLTSPTGTWRYSVRCTSGNETLVASPTFTVP